MDIFYALPTSFLSATWYEIALYGFAFFAAIYIGLGLITVVLTHYLLPALHWGAKLDKRALAQGQRLREWQQSASSILIFGVGLIIPWAMLRLGFASFSNNASALQITLEIVGLMLWNEVHFYACHRLLHTKPLQRFHLPHHRSVVTTPWATYSFHPIEAAMLGSVLLLPMMLHAFSFWALAAVPIVSLIFNNIGHSNYDFLPFASKARWWLNGAHRHHLHHICYRGNYGFLLPFVDRCLNTALAPDAGEKVLNAVRKAAD